MGEPCGTPTPPPGEVTTTVAGEAELAAVLAVLDESAAALAARGILGWPAAFARDLLEPAFGAGEVWLARRAGVPVATFTVSWTDVLWPDDAAAGYLHRFAVRRAAAGSGAALVGRAAALVRDRRRSWLRLDCMADNAALRAYYARAGFRHVDDVAVPRSAIRWPVAAPVVSRYERAVAPAVVTTRPGSTAPRGSR